LPSIFAFTADVTNVLPVLRQVPQSGTASIRIISARTDHGGLTMEATITAPARHDHMQWVLTAVAVAATLAVALILALVLGSDGSSGSTDPVPRSTQVEGSGSGAGATQSPDSVDRAPSPGSGAQVTSSPDAVDRASTGNRASSQPSQAF
jgi:hypothetical protein